jgi:YVTN family beta-propeller protein
MRSRFPLATLIAALVAAAGHVVVTDAAQSYTLVKEIPVGGEGGWDYLFVDSPAKRLYVSHATKVVVIDLATDTVVGEIADTPGVHGAVAATPGRIFTSNGRSNNVSIVDAKTLQTIGKVATGRGPDFILYEPTHKEVYTFNGAGKSATVIDAASGAVVATVPLGGTPEAAVSDGSAGRVFVNMEDLNTIAVIDVTTHKVLESWPIAPGTSASGLAIDEQNHRLFIGAHNNLMLMMDSTTGSVVASVPIGAGVDSTWFDPGTGNAFSSCGDGSLTIAHEDSPTRLSVVEVLTTARGARTMAVDPATHRIYVAASKFAPPEPGADAKARPVIVPNSMRILVYGTR